MSLIQITVGDDYVNMSDNKPYIEKSSDVGPSVRFKMDTSEKVRLEV